MIQSSAGRERALHGDSAVTIERDQMGGARGARPARPPASRLRVPAGSPESPRDQRHDRTFCHECCPRIRTGRLAASFH